MPRYFFHLVDGKVAHDATGTELEDIVEARQHAVKMAIDLMQEDSAMWPSTRGWRIMVADSSGDIVAEARFSIERLHGVTEADLGAMRK